MMRRCYERPAAQPEGTCRDTARFIVVAVVYELLVVRVDSQNTSQSTSSDINGKLIDDPRCVAYFAWQSM